MKTLQQWQKDIDNLLQTYEKPYWSPLSQYARLAEEVGELGKVLNHKYGDKPPKPSDIDDLEGELGDVLWTVVLIANAEGVDLEKSLQDAMDKLTKRDQHRFAKKN